MKKRKMKIRRGFILAGVLLIMTVWPAGESEGQSFRSVTQESVEEQDSDAAALFIETGHDYRMAGDEDAALVEYGKAIRWFSERNGMSAPNHHFAGPHTLLLLEALSAKGQLLSDRYRNRGHFQDLQTAFETLRLAIHILDRLQLNLEHDTSGRNLIGENHTLFEEALFAAYHLYNRTGDDYYLERAYHITEWSKSGVARALIQKMEQDVVVSAAVQGRVRMKQGRQVAALERIQKEVLEENQVMLSYLLGDRYLFLIMISRHRVSLQKLDSPLELPGLVEKLLESLQKRSLPLLEMTAARLYELLLKPVERELTVFDQLLIAPDHTLNYLPFELLLTRPVDGQPPWEWPYLIREYRISYTPSMSVYYKTRKDRRKRREKFLALAPWAETTGRVNVSGHLTGYGLQRTSLPVSRYEIEEISKLFRNRRGFWYRFLSGRDMTLLFNEDATVEEIKQRDLRGYTYIHFATHAIIHENHPSLSAIVMANGGGGEGMIYLDDIYNLELDADLIVLSACETGLGSFARGEGVVGFSRAFIYSGAQNLLVSMWKVNDRSTAELMIRFYSELLAGAGKAEALRKAKLFLMRRSETAFPSDWASFILIGG